MRLPFLRPILERLLLTMLIGCSAVTSASALRAQEVPPRPSIKVDPRILDTYVGEYELFPKLVLTLDRFRDRLIAQLTNQPPLVVFAETETKFYWKIVEAQFTIQKDQDGKVTGVLFEQGGVKLKGKRIAGKPSSATDLDESEEPLQSRRLAALAKEWKGGNKAALSEFWKEVEDKAPLVEPIAGSESHSWVTFLWRGDAKTRRVLIEGGPPTGERDVLLTRLADTDLWYRTVRIPNEARFSYLFQVNRPVKLPEDDAGEARIMSQFPLRPDPLNPRTVEAQSLLASVVELPGAPLQPWLVRLPGVAKGDLSEHKIKSEILKAQRAVTLYTPANYDPKGPECRLLVLFDGPLYQVSEGIPGPAILDNLIAKQKIPPLVAVFVTHAPQNRDKELSCSEPFADFVAKELVPWVRKNYHVSAEPQHTMVGGLSLGGLMASFCGLRHASVFGNVLSQSGSYQWGPGMFDGKAKDVEPGWLTRQFVAAPRQPVRFYLEAGRYEHHFPVSLFAENRRFRDVLEAKGYNVHYAEFAGGHDYLTWRGSLADGLIALTGNMQKNEVPGGLGR